MNFDLEPSQENNVVNDILSFAWIPLMKTSDPSEYEDMGVLGSVIQLVVLIVFNTIAFLASIQLIIGGNPYIDFSRELAYLPFNIVFVFLAFVSFLTNLMVQFLCFRVVSGKGNLLAQGYLSALGTTNIAILIWLNIGVLSVIRLPGLINLIFSIASIYMIVPFFVSMRGVHRISIVRALTGYVLSVLGSIPVMVLYFLLLNYFGEAYPFQIYHWTPMFILSLLLFIGIFILAYILWQQELEPEYPEGVPVRRPIQEMLKIRWVKIPLRITLALAGLFVLIEIAPLDLPDDMLFPQYSVITPVIFVAALILIFAIWVRNLFIRRGEDISLRNLWFKRMDH